LSLSFWLSHQYPIFFICYRHSQIFELCHIFKPCYLSLCQDFALHFCDKDSNIYLVFSVLLDQPPC
jgi:hypothetical protein